MPHSAPALATAHAAHPMDRTLASYVVVSVNTRTGWREASLTPGQARFLAAELIHAAQRAEDNLGGAR